MNTNTKYTASSRAHECKYSLEEVDLYFTEGSDLPDLTLYYFFVSIPCTCGAIAKSLMEIFVQESEITDIRFTATNDHCGCNYVIDLYGDIESYIYENICEDALNDVVGLSECPITSIIDPKRGHSQRSIYRVR